MKTESYFRALDQKHERTQPSRLPYYWPSGSLQKFCSYCDGPVPEKHPAGALDVCPVWEASR